MLDSIARAWRWLSQWFTTSRKRRDIGRNDPCWCGSGKKYKHCHYRVDARKGTLTAHSTPAAQKEMMERSMKRQEQLRAKTKRRK